MQSDKDLGDTPFPQPSDRDRVPPPPYEQSFLPSGPPAPDAGQRFGGASVEPPSQRHPPRTKRPMLTCLGVIVVLGILVVAGIALLLSQIGDVFHVAAPFPSRVTSQTVGLVRIDDVIVDESNTIEVIEHYEDKKNIHAILVRIDSPGGGVGPSQEIYEAVQRLRDKGKKVVVSMGSVAASGGYYIACAADEIYANPGTMTGSIGVIIGIPNLQKIADKIGFDYQVVKSGKFKDTGSPARALTDEERALMQDMIDDVYNQFVEAILDNREMQIEAAVAEMNSDEAESLMGGRTPKDAEDFLRAIADGRVMTGRQAVRYGLADGEGTQQDALDRLAELAGIGSPRLYEYRPRRPLSELLEASARTALHSARLPIEGMRIEYRMPY